MRLSSLKLSGFKSFADSTTLQFKDNRTAVVGPNGCGKSNVIDAIRWVMGNPVHASYVVAVCRMLFLLERQSESLSVWLV